MPDHNDTSRRADEPVILERGQHPISQGDIDPDALKILYRLDRLGFIACLCGGAVRDLMLGKRPKDFDIVTDARPGQIKKRFGNVYVIGRRFRLAHIHFGGGKIIEVATFRKDPGPGEENAPETDHDPKNAYGTPREDAFRRDISINALLYDAASASVVDYVGGLEDLSRRKVRVIGDPAERFTEDPVRVWRVIRHAARLGFDIDEATAMAVRSHGHLLAASAGSRLYEELNKDLAYETRPVIQELRRFGVLKHFLGRLGEDLETDAGLFARLDALLAVVDGAKAAKCELSSDETYALLLWPWFQPLFEGQEEDMHPVLIKALENARLALTVPRIVRANAVQTLIIVESMLKALRTGRMLWSLQRRAHYAQASRLAFLIEKGRAPQAGESFEGLFRSAFPSAAVGSKRKRRRRRRIPAAGGGTSGGPIE
jgi:poly(A) polymerase